MSHLLCFWSCISELYHLVSFAVFTIMPLQPDEGYTGPTGVDDANLCKCSTVGYSLLSACGGCQDAQWITYDFRRCPLPVFTYLSLAGRNIRTTARVLCLPPREFLSWQIILTLTLAHRFPNPIPAGTRVPRWALLDVTVRCQTFFLRITYSQHVPV